MSKTDATKLQVLQNNCIRTCLKCDKLTPRHDLYTKSGIKPLDIQRKEHTSLVVYQGLNCETSPYINEMSTRRYDKTGKATRSAIEGNVHIPHTKLQLSKGNIRICGPTYYNQIPVNIRESKSKNVFKRNLKQHEVFNNAVT